MVHSKHQWRGRKSCDRKYCGKLFLMHVLYRTKILRNHMAITNTLCGKYNTYTFVILRFLVNLGEALPPMTAHHWLALIHQSSIFASNHIIFLSVVSWGPWASFLFELTDCWTSQYTEYVCETTSQIVQLKHRLKTGGCLCEPTNVCLKRSPVIVLYP